MPPSFFSLKLLILHIFHPYSGGGGRACAATSSYAAIGMKDSYEDASINSLSRPGVDDGLWCGVAPLTAHGTNVDGVWLHDG
jgi:hypothetical protein